MLYESFEKFQYNSCVSKGICSLSPKNSALQTALVLYLRLFSKFAKDIEVSFDLKIFILNVISAAFYNPEFNEETFLSIIKVLKKDLLFLEKKYVEKFPDINIEDERAKLKELIKQTETALLAIRYGESVFKRSLENIPDEIRDIYNILLIIAKSLSINILELYSYDKFSNVGFNYILEILSLINLNERNFDVLKNEAFQSAKIDIEILNEIHFEQEKRYGEQGKNEVSYSTSPGNAVLVVGSNIRELEIILEALKNESIDIYTHDDMMLAYTFPKFKEYSRLKGQYGQGIENCLLDFATFPGPIILTKNSLHNIENLYRGRLFTTDFILPKGVIKIEDNDFSEVIISAKDSKGFKTGKLCETVSIGYDYEETISKIYNKLNSENYKQIFFIGTDGYSLEQRIYFEKLIKLTPNDVLVVSFSYNIEKENLISINTCFDYQGMMRVFEALKDFEISKTVFVPKCEKSTISQMIYLSKEKNTRIYVGKCTPIIINPSLMNTLEKVFGINPITSAKKDLDIITKDF